MGPIVGAEMTGFLVAGGAGRGGELRVHHVPDVGAGEERPRHGLHVQPHADRRHRHLLGALPWRRHASRKVLEGSRFTHALALAFALPSLSSCGDFL